MNQESDQTDKAPEGEKEGAPAATVSRLQRLKQFLVADYLRTIDRLSRTLKRLRGLVGKSGESRGPDEEAGAKEERSEARSTSRKTKGPAAGETAPATAPPAPHSRVRSVLIYLLVMIAGIIAGMIFSFALLSNMVVNQAQKIGDQRDEITQLEKQYSRVLESEARYRNRLADAESRLNQLTRKMERDAAAAEPPAAPTAPADKAGVARKTANCSVESGTPDRLARCLEEYNRKTGR